MDKRLYHTSAWRDAREYVLARDGHRCTVARLLGGYCTDRLDVHHLVRPEDGGGMFDVDNLVTVCSTHHPKLEALRRFMSRDRGWRSCTHEHRYPGAREECERRLNRELLPA